MRDRIVFDAKVSDKKILMVPTETIVGTPYNPKARTQEGAKLRRLADSVQRYGLIQPLLITTERDLVDGNRRLAAAKLAGLPLVECIVLPEGVDKDKVFCEVNTTAEKIGGKGWLEACRHGYKTPPAREKAMYDELLRLVGTYGIDMLIAHKLGLNILPLCKDVRSLGLPVRLDELILKVAERKLTNRINAIRRSDMPVDGKVQQIMGLLA
jgi:hypothetical protein